jgi:hypothetical protein
MSTGQVLAFLRQPSSCDWTQQELAEFYRVEDALLQGGFAVTTDRGVSDEGDPWFVVCRADTEEVIAHFARIDREYVIASNLHPGAAYGRDFRALVRGMLESHPLTLPIRRNQGQKVLLHPATLLVALLATAYMISSEKELSTDGHVKSASIASLLIEKFAIFAAAILAATWLENKADWTLNAFEKGPLFHLFHDDKTAVAAGHDVAPLDSISHNLPSSDIGGHRSDQTNQVLGLTTKTDETSAQDGALKAINCATPAHSPSENTSDANTPPPDHNGNDDQAATPSSAGHNDCTSLGLSNLQAPIAAASIAAAAVNSTASSQASTEGSQGNAIDGPVVATDAYHLTASEISSFSTPTLLLSTAPVTVNVALEQAFAQVGLGGAPAHDLTSSGGTLTFGTVQSATAEVAPVSASSQTAAPSGSGPGIQTVQQEIAQFVDSNPSVEVTLSGANVVIIDTHVADAKSPNYGVMTFDMNDGSTLSIVGILPSHPHVVSA